MRELASSRGDNDARQQMKPYKRNPPIFDDLKNRFFIAVTIISCAYVIRCSISWIH